jgi:hypothetical protein
MRFYGFFWLERQVGGEKNKNKIKTFKDALKRATKTPNLNIRTIKGMSRYKY